MMQSLIIQPLYRNFIILTFLPSPTTLPPPPVALSRRTHHRPQTSPSPTNPPPLPSPPSSPNSTPPPMVKECGAEKNSTEPHAGLHANSDPFFKDTQTTVSLQFP
ncbi:hypothetical protein JHK82_020710 [Glycine max]|uniref:Uncharacterized protein n=1 Tax=Glycine max TaxID=3847 RepID=K7L5F0_SOYBN|nr:hypothetical protein JHK87_020607 [Glycine soja]KAG5024806.1 hypothetical protein JHK86_020720 [Glycine max]KAG5135979.1 hypothetical protein JHK82_020710 [Glycine max]KAH1050091.1 hypothetical protein GYH30_020522 [Glycine max]KRH42176.1 hypothetical protein GLYMA_08G073400v4 [Glycine max]